jgi:hypothetical protein
MEIVGKVISLLPLQKGQGKNGEWKKQEFILETEGQYPKKVCISVWGDKVDQFRISEGEKLTASIEVESREFNGRWYTDVKAWRVVKGAAAAAAESAQVPNAPLPPAPEDDLEDLPF